MCAVPLLDMVRYHLFGIGKTWMPEYGSADDPAQFKALFAYSPYHHVREGGATRPVLMLSADSDDRVDPMHAPQVRGGAAARRVERAGAAARRGNAGHGGADLVAKAIELSADLFAFLFTVLWASRRRHFQGRCERHSRAAKPPDTHTDGPKVFPCLQANVPLSFTAGNGGWRGAVL